MEKKTLPEKGMKKTLDAFLRYQRESEKRLKKHEKEKGGRKLQNLKRSGGKKSESMRCI